MRPKTSGVGLLGGRLGRMKAAVFQISECDGGVRLICVHVRGMKEAFDMEVTLQECLPPRMHVTFLGRFDRVDVVTDLDDGSSCPIDSSSTWAESLGGLHLIRKSYQG